MKIGPADHEIVRLQVNKSAITQYLVAMATSLDKLEKIGTDPSSTRKALSYGEKIAKIGPVRPDIWRNTLTHDVDTQRNFD